MKIKVTQEHIDKGTDNEPELCPVALAIKEVFGMWAFVSVSECSIIVADRILFVPTSVHDFVERFDNGYTVDPFEFELGL